MTSLLYRLSAIALSFLLAASFAFGGMALAKGHPRPSLRVSPHKVDMGHSATVQGSHLPTKGYFGLLLMVANGKTRPYEKILRGLLHTDRHGNARATVRIPIMLRCGKAAIVAFSGQKIDARGSFILGGCKPKPGGPPPPPSTPKKKHKK